ncbi:hypothetical protein [Celerinatantimonas sp. YJH-8]|uniref:hypothetical protein n=1 Tax=Celerinatantimonas sp. YJH-8 TaxID=3228714 RepID=UPI0038C44899
MNRLMLSATIMLFAGQALGRVVTPFSGLQNWGGIRFLAAMAVAGVICYGIRKLRHR